MSKWPQFNQEYAKSVTEDEFVKQHEHLADRFDLEQVHKDLTEGQMQKPVKPIADGKKNHK